MVDEWLRHYRGYLLVSLGWLMVVGIVIIALRRPTTAPIELLPPPSPTPSPTPIPTPTPPPLRVYVSGAVMHPDVYTLPPGSIVKDAVEAAGGPSPEADLDLLNLATVLLDGMQVHVPRHGDGEPPPPISGGTQSAVTDESHSGASSGGQININTASVESLETLPGIGPALAQRIVENRPYQTIEDIKRVPGIGEATFQRLKNSITVK